MKGRSAPELAAAGLFAQLDFLPVSDERRYYQNSSLAASLHCPSIQASIYGSHFSRFDPLPDDRK